MIIALVPCGQILELGAKVRTGPAVSALFNLAAKGIGAICEDGSE